MAKSKHRKKHGKRLNGFQSGRSHRSGKRFHGMEGGFNPMDILSDFAGLLLGAVIGSAAAKMIPLKNIYAKSAIPAIIGGIAVSMPALARIRILHRAGMGSLAIGGYSVIKAAIPKLPLLTGAETAEGVAEMIEGLDSEERALLGIMPDDATAGTAGQPQIEQQGTAGAAPGEMLGTEMIGTEMIGTEYVQGNAPGEMLGEDGADFE